MSPIYKAETSKGRGITRSSRVPSHLLTVALLCTAAAYLPVACRLDSFARGIAYLASAAWVGLWKRSRRSEFRLPCARETGVVNAKEIVDLDSNGPGLIEIVSPFSRIRSNMA